MSKSGFGERLRRNRELRGVSRDEVCAATRIGARFLEALENEHWESLPGGVFNRGFLRALARFLGIDEDELIAQYDLAISERARYVVPAVNPLMTPASSKKRPARLAFLGTLCGIVLLAAAWFGWSSYDIREAIVGRAGAVSKLLAASRPDRKLVAVSIDNAGATASTAVTAVPKSSAALGQGLELKVEAGKETAVTVSTDGSKVFEGSMIAGQSRTFTARDAIELSAKDSGALLLELNGQTLAPLGPPGQPGNVTLTPSDIKPAGGGAN